VRECLVRVRGILQIGRILKSGKKILKKQKVAAGKKRFGSAFRLVTRGDDTRV
jgi:hypothetical protein